MIASSRAVDGGAITLGDFLAKQHSFYVPLFQRDYSWESSEVTRLIKDLWQAHGGTNKRETFLGSLVTQSQPTSKRFNLIDGQQRFTTINLMFIALREMFQLAGRKKAVDHFDNQLQTPKVVTQPSDFNLPSIHAVAALTCKHMQDPDSATGEGENQPFLTLGDSTNDLFSTLVNKGELYKELCEVRQAKSPQKG